MLFEALVGERPFRGATAGELLESMQRGERLARGRLDRRIEAVLARGLSFAPEDRFADMIDLLDALTRARERRSVRWAILLAGTTALAAATGVLASVASERPEPCADAAGTHRGRLERRAQQHHRDELRGDAVVDGRRRRAVGPRTVDAFAERWTESYRKACTATLVEHVQAPRTMEMRVGCLERAKHRFDIVIEALTRADAATVQNVDRIVDELPALDRCDDVERLHASASLEPAPGIADRVQAVRAALTRAELLRDEGRLPLADEAARTARADALTLGHAPLDVEASLVLAGVLLERETPEEAETLAREAFTNATRYELEEPAVRALNRLAAALRPDRARRSEARFVSDVALALAARVDAGGRTEAVALESRMRLLDIAGDHVEAIAVQRRAFANIEANAGPDERVTAHYATTLGTVLWRGGEAVEAEQLLRRAIEIHERIESPDHLLLVSKSVLAVVLTDMGRLDEAEALKRWALITSIISYGPTHPKVAVAHSQLAACLQGRGEFDGARRHQLAALVIYGVAGDGRGWQSMMALAQISALEGDMERAWDWAVRGNEAAKAELGADSFELTQPLSVLSFLAATRGDTVVAIATQREIVARTKRMYGSDHVETARAFAGLADTMVIAAPWSETEPLYREALRVLVRDLPGDHDAIAFVRQNLADVLRFGGELVEARAQLELTWSVRSSIGTTPVLRGIAAFSLATVLGASPREHARARELARTALALFEEGATSESLDYAAQVRAWLAHEPDATFFELAARGHDARRS